MGEFFKGWRRKLGVVTLGLACVLAAGWVRSLSGGEALAIPLDSGGGLVLISGHGLFTIGAWPEIGSKISLESIPDPAWKSSISFLSFIPYWLIVIPLTVLSAYLLMSKPRASKPVKST